MYAGSAKEEFTEDQPKLRFDFDKANVHNGQWICYEQENYNDASLGQAKILVLDESNGLQPIGFKPRSIRIVKSFETGVTLYQHENYGGTQRDVYSSTPSIAYGVSSALISVGSWRLFQAESYQGPYYTKGPGKYPRAGNLEIPNDMLRSMERQDQ